MLQEWATTLLAYQEQLLRIAKLQKVLDGVPGQQKAIQERCSAERAAYKQAQDKVKALELATRELEKEADAVRAKKREFQSKSAFIKNNDEYRAAMVQIEQCNAVIASFEEQQLAKMIEMEDNKAVVAEKKQALDEAEAKSKEALDALAATVSENESRKAELAKALPELEAAVEPALLREYKRLRQSKYILPTQPVLVAVDCGACGNCHMRLQPQLINNTLVGKMERCPSCQVLLYHDENADN